MIQTINLNTTKALEGVVQPNKPSMPTPSESIKEFSSYLTNALNGVAAQEKNVETLNSQFQLGQVSVDQVMIASEQALLSLQLTTQVRNKVIEAYQEIMRTQI
ncbi:flagellar hook-basal body complex protein FliE [Paenibacillus segetis]|uniref:Flagellar hook-basal body complex protein FliE n=1 Tax=Paenibacillus segetis TaxID=1325360 RepID=A0ABQ1Y9F6_9BACL|nr:flagellar hook-basal body complex protein FliE [Paenibacillus segetis]GGH17579.1 flagellar hook-basal body complex protein FliE [Paenibacillus segetis]